MKLSVVIITLNEEKNILRCINSLIPVADEFIILDAFSTDNTVNIVRAKGIEVIRREWQGYSNAKNFANALATGDFILSIDADEELSPELTTSIATFKQNSVADVCELNRLTNYCGKWIRHSGWYPEYKIRIFRNGLAEWKGSIHEDVVFKKEYTSTKLRGNLNHYSYPTFESHLKKTYMYASLAAQRDVESGKRYTLLINGLLKPWYTFVRKYFLQLGFLDGFYGLVIAILSAFERFLRFVHFKQLKKEFSGEIPVRNKIKVLHLSSEKAWRGGEQQIAYLIGELTKAGVENFVATRKDSEFERYAKSNGLLFFSLRFANSFDFRSAWQLKRICNDLQITIMHLHSSKSHSIGVLSSLLGNKATIILSRRVDFIPKQDLMTKWKYNHSSIKRIVCVSDKINRTMRAFVKRPERCVTIHSGIDLNKFITKSTDNFLRREFKIAENVALIGNTSALDEHKDYKTFIDTIFILKEKMIPVKGIIIGTGIQQELLKKYVSAKNLDKCIIFTGFRNDIKNILPSLSIFLMTTRIEGLGTSILDAFLAEVPVVSTNAGGIPEMVIHEQTGMLAPIGDSTTLALHIEKILKDDSLRMRLVREAKHKVAEFSKEQTATKTLSLYQEVLLNGN